MSEKTLYSVAQYTRHVHARVHVRPYELKSPLQNDISGKFVTDKMPEDDHYRVELELTFNALAKEDLLCFEASCCVEAIVVAKGFTDEELAQVLTHNIGGLLVGNIRAAIATASMSTGYGPIHLPPITTDQLTALLAKSS